MQSLAKKSQSVEGEFVPLGCALFLDTRLMDSQFVLSEMTEAWVQSTTDPVFRKLEVKQRRLLQWVFHLGLSVSEIATVLDRNPQTVASHLTAILHYLKHHLTYQAAGASGSYA